MLYTTSLTVMLRDDLYGTAIAISEEEIHIRTNSQKKPTHILIKFPSMDTDFIGEVIRTEKNLHIFKIDRIKTAGFSLDALNYYLGRFHGYEK